MSETVGTRNPAVQRGGTEAVPVAFSESLNPAQQEAVHYGLDAAGAIPGPLLVIAGAGSGKTLTLAHRVANLLVHGADARRILLLTFTRRAASEMTRRASRIATSAMRESRMRPASLPWAGTFHSVANRLLRQHAQSVGLDPSFSVLDRSDAADLIDWLRAERGLSKKSSRFPRKGTCLAIYSHAVNAQIDVETTLSRAFPWCGEHAESLGLLFRDYVEAKQARQLLDYDDLLLYWFHLMSEPALAEVVREQFDHVLVDEYQDTNALQASVLQALSPCGKGMTVVGDDAQSIYAFRAATVRNILDFPQRFDPPAKVVKLEHNYRSTRPILAACNALMEEASEGFSKRLFSERESCAKPELVTSEDEALQVEYVVERILAHREDGIPLKQQAVLMRASHHSDALEVELGRRNIPFVKFGGLKFLEAAHVKDVLSVLRWAENEKDELAAHRVLQLLPGVGPKTARSAFDTVVRLGYEPAALESYVPPAAAAADWAPLCVLMRRLRETDSAWEGQLRAVRQWYEPHLARLHDSPHVRAGDLEQLELVSASYPTRERFLTELTLDPPSATADEAGAPHLDEDYLILSTIHSSKGQEWDVVFVINVVDGCIPSDMATGKPEEIDEERRLLYVAMSRARDHLHLVQPLRFYVRQQARHGDAHVFAPRSRFLAESVVEQFSLRSYGPPRESDGEPVRRVQVDVASRLRSMW